MARRPLALLLLISTVPAAAQTVATSHAPDGVAVTVYRDPQRPAARAMNVQWLNGFALITERRRVSLPAGESELRFEGVASGILPQSAIVTGLPGDLVERNRDAYLLSPGTLLDRSLGARVHLRRTQPRTGQLREEDAIIRTGADGAVVLQTSEGFEALRCTGLPETLVYDRVPPELSARPTLSVRMRARQPVTAEVTLAYIATGFDWQANYVADVSPDGTHLSLFAWLTLASGDDTSFPEANTQAVAGRLDWAGERAPAVESDPIDLHCWPSETTSDIGPESFAGPPPPPRPPAMMAGYASSEIVVTGSRVMARQEELGDLKLYRIPEPVTVAAHGEKQVAMLQQPHVAFTTIYRLDIDPVQTFDPRPATRVLITRNRAAEGLGLPLPSGGIAVFQSLGGRRVLVGQGSVSDNAIGEIVEIPIGEASDVAVTMNDSGKEDEQVLVVTNAEPRSVQFEARFRSEAMRMVTSAPLPERNGRRVWTVTVPANGSVSLRYRVQALN